MIFSCIRKHSRTLQSEQLAWRLHSCTFTVKKSGSRSPGRFSSITSWAKAWWEWQILFLDHPNLCFSCLQTCEHIVFVLCTQVGHVEVVNKQYVKVFPAHGVSTSEVVRDTIILLYVQCLLRPDIGMIRSLHTTQFLLNHVSYLILLLKENALLEFLKLKIKIDSRCLLSYPQ